MSKINKDSYLDAVRKVRTQSAQKIGRFLKIDRTTVFRYKKSNPDVVDEGEEIIKQFAVQDDKNTWNTKINTWEYFDNLEVIVKWKDALRLKPVGENKIFDYTRSFWYVCMHLKVHPDRADLEEVAELVKEAKRKYWAGEKMPKGLAYTRIREGVRSFYTVVKKISMEHITTLGVTKEASLGQGMFSTQRVIKPIRKRLVDWINAHEKLTEHEKMEAIHADKLMYYWGSRVTATLEFNFVERKYSLQKKIWSCTILDKGERGGKEWKKDLIGFALDEFKEYCSKRFNIPIDQLETELPLKTTHLFPSFIKRNKKGELEANEAKLGDINRIGLMACGLPYKKFPPNHIWRHTFAQDGLEATDLNFDLVAELGGWDSSDTLKKHYGKMSDDSKRRGLSHMMKIPVEDVTYELRW
jgi:integrase